MRLVSTLEKSDNAVRGQNPKFSRHLTPSRSVLLICIVPMSPRVLLSCSIIAAVFAAGACGIAQAQLASKSPFLPPQGAEAAAPLEYRGYMITSEGVQYRIVDPVKKVGTWVKLNQRDTTFDVLAKQHDGTHKTITIEHQGRTLTLAERESKIVSAGNAAQAVPPPVVAPQPPINVAPAVMQSVVLNPTPSDEQKRLEAVAAEVARRRALREQATQQIGQGVTPQVTVPQNVQPMQRPVQPPGNFQRPGMNVPGSSPNTTNRQSR